MQSLAKVSVGSVLQSGQPFITLVPIDAALEVEANIEGSENGFVHTGDRRRGQIRYVPLYAIWHGGGPGAHR